MSPPVQELPTAYKSVRLYRLPLRGRHAQWSCPTNMERTLAVGRDDSARRCRNFRPRTNLFVCTVCRFAVGGDMSPPYRGYCKSGRTSVGWGHVPTLHALPTFAPYRGGQSTSLARGRFQRKYAESRRITSTSTMAISMAAYCGRQRQSSVQATAPSREAQA